MKLRVPFWIGFICLGLSVLLMIFALGGGELLSIVLGFFLFPVVWVGLFALLGLPTYLLTWNLRNADSEQNRSIEEKDTSPPA
jgi:hypothetical protein